MLLSPSGSDLTLRTPPLVVKPSVMIRFFLMYDSCPPTISKSPRLCPKSLSMAKLRSFFPLHVCANRLLSQFS